MKALSLSNYTSSPPDIQNPCRLTRTKHPCKLTSTLHANIYTSFQQLTALHYWHMWWCVHRRVFCRAWQVRLWCSVWGCCLGILKARTRWCCTAEKSAQNGMPVLTCNLIWYSQHRTIVHQVSCEACLYSINIVFAPASAWSSHLMLSPTKPSNAEQLAIMAPAASLCSIKKISERQ